MYSFILAALVIAGVTLIASHLARNDVIQVSREPGPGTGNALGYQLFQNICPKCGSAEGFFKGEKKGLEQGPDYLYYGQRGEGFHRQSRVWKAEGV